MKIDQVKFKIAMVFGAAAILAVFITRPANAQETAKKDPHQKIIVKIVRDDNGKTTVIDTTMELTDSSMVDSINQEIEKVIVLGKSGKHARMMHHNMPQGFRYNFEVPCPPDCAGAMEELEGQDFEGTAPCGGMEEFMCDRMDRGAENRLMRSGGSGQSLNDLLGDIPMERVVSYSIKDRKNGKRIIIDLNDAPMFEKQERVIVIREPGRVHRNMNRGDRQVKVIVNTEDDDTKVERSADQPVPPPPPPPPPAKPKTK